VIVLLTMALPRLVPSVARPAHGAQRMTLSATVAQGGKDPSRPGFFTRLLGGDETVGRDTAGHTAITRDTGAEPETRRDTADR
jgi:hypothetical protein